MYADATLHLGCVVALAHDLSHAYGLYRTATTPHRLDPPDSPHHFPSSQVLQLDVIIRDCIRRHWSTPENKVLLSRGAHIFSSLGLLRSLLQETNSGEGTPLQFLRQIHRVVEEYESVGNGIDVGASPLPLPTEKYLRRLHSGVILLTLDTLENVVSDPTTEFVQLQSSLLSTQQWDTIEALLSVEEEQQQLGGDAEGLKLLVILCDTPIVWQDAESDTKTIWQHQNDSNRSNINGSHHSTESSATAFANPWSLYPQERARLLRLIFRKKEKNPAFHVTLLCSGPRASRTTIRDNDTGCHLEQIVLGPVSSSPPSRPIIDPARTLAGGKLLDSRYSYTHEFPAADGQHPPQYCVLDLVAHARGSTSAVHFYVQDRPEARILVGPVIGRVTPKSARILIELDRAAEKCACVLMDVATGQRYVAVRPSLMHINCPLPFHHLFCHCGCLLETATQRKSASKPSRQRLSKWKRCLQAVGSRFPLKYGTSALVFACVCLRIDCRLTLHDLLPLFCLVLLGRLGIGEWHLGVCADATADTACLGMGRCAAQHDGEVCLVVQA